jgi:hypothetical protein
MAMGHSIRLRRHRHQRIVRSVVFRGCRKVLRFLGVDMRPGKPRCFVRVPIGRSPLGCFGNPTVAELQAVPDTKQPIAKLHQVTLIAS